MMQNRVVMMHNGIEVDVSRALPAMDRTVERSRITEAHLQAASSDLVDAKPKRAKWFCLQVMTGREFSVEKQLSDAQIRFSSPRQMTCFIRKGRKILSERPFFPGYILVQCVPSAEAFDGLKRVKNVLDIVGGIGGYHVVNDADVSVFNAMTTPEAPRMETNKTFQDGDEGYIEHGPFAGFNCVVVKVTWCREARAEVRINVRGRNFDIKSMPLAFVTKL